MNKNILIVDDEADIRRLIRGILEDEGYTVREAVKSSEAFDALTEKPADLIIQDIWLQGSDLDGLEILERVKVGYPHMPVIMISGHGTIETAVKALKKGAYDFIEKPFKSNRLILMVRRAIEAAALRRENEKLNNTLKKQTITPDEFIGDSDAMNALRDALENVSKTNSRVLLTGEAGTGKDLAATLIHKQSPRADKPFIVLNCATLHPDNFEVELFGKAGDHAAQGLLEQANGGVLFLDEVSDMPLATQGKIVRILQGQGFHRVGGTQSISVDVRIIAATNKTLEDEITAGRFREDLYYRLNVVPIAMPPLRAYADDIPKLAAFFLEQLSARLNMTCPRLSKSALSTLQAHDWRGNVRQLRNVMEWILIMHGPALLHDDKTNATIQPQHLPPDMQRGRGGLTDTGSILNTIPTRNAVNDDQINIHRFTDQPLRDARAAFECAYLSAQLTRFDGHISNMANFIGMERSALHRKLKSLNITGDNSKNA